MALSMQICLITDVMLELIYRVCFNKVYFTVSVSVITFSGFIIDYFVNRVIIFVYKLECICLLM